MRKSRYTEEQIVGILKESEAGLATTEKCTRGEKAYARFVRIAALRDSQMEYDKAIFAIKHSGTRDTAPRGHSARNTQSTPEGED